MPAGAPSAFAIASLAANRAASELAADRRSSGVNSRVAQRGARSSAATKRVDVDDVDAPTPLALTRP